MIQLSDSVTELKWVNTLSLQPSANQIQIFLRQCYKQANMGDSLSTDSLPYPPHYSDLLCQTQIYTSLASSQAYSVSSTTVLLIKLDGDNIICPSFVGSFL